MSPRRGSSTARARAITAWWGATRLTSTPPLTPTQTVIPTETPTLTPGGARCHARLLHGMPGGGLPHREPARPHRGTGEGGRPVGRALRVPRQVPPSGAAARVRHHAALPPALPPARLLPRFTLPAVIPRAAVPRRPPPGLGDYSDEAAAEAEKDLPAGSETPDEWEQEQVQAAQRAEQSKKHRPFKAPTL